MKKNLLIIFILIGVFLLGCFAYTRYVNTPRVTGSNLATAVDFSRDVPAISIKSLSDNYSAVKKFISPLSTFGEGVDSNKFPDSIESNEEILALFYPKNSSDWLLFSDATDIGTGVLLAYPKGWVNFIRSNFYDDLHLFSPFTEVAYEYPWGKSSLYAPFASVRRLSFNVYDYGKFQKGDISFIKSTEASFMLSRLMLKKENTVSLESVYNSYSQKRVAQMDNIAKKKNVRSSRFQPHIHDNDQVIVYLWHIPAIKGEDVYKDQNVFEIHALWPDLVTGSIYHLSMRKTDSGTDTDPNKLYGLFMQIYKTVVVGSKNKSTTVPSDSSILVTEDVVPVDGVDISTIDHDMIYAR